MQIMTKPFILLLTLFRLDISAIAQNNYARQYSVIQISATSIEESNEVKALSKSINLNDSLLLKGIVKMENSNEPLPFASIQLKNNKVFTYSDVNGNFQLNIKNYRSLKFPDTLQINYAGLKPYKIAVNSIEELSAIFNLSNSFSLNPVQPIETIQEGPYPVFTIKEPSDGYVQVVETKKIMKKQKRVRAKSK